MPIDISDKEGLNVPLTGTQMNDAIVQAYNSKDAIENIEGMSASGSEIDKSTEKINSNIIQIDKLLNLITKSKNLFDVSTITLGKYMSSSTALDNDIYSISSYIEIEGSKNYVCNTKLRFVAYFDLNKTFISSIPVVESGFTFLSPENAKYMIVTLYNSEDLNVLQLEEGIASTSFSPHGYMYTNNLSELLDNNIPNESVSFDSLDFIEIGKNKFNKMTGHEGFLMKETGTVETSTTYSYSDYIKVTEGEYYFTNQKLRFVNFFDSSKALLPLIGLQGLEMESFAIPSGVSYMIVTYGTEYKNKLQIEIGEMYSGYEGYHYYYKDTYMREKESNEDIATISPIQYVCPTKETNFYNENVLRNSKKYLGQTDIVLNIDASKWKNTSISSKLISASSLSGLYSANLKVVDDDFITILDKDFEVNIVDMEKNNAVTVGNIGDSYTGRMTWANDILAEAIPSQNLTFIGLRNASVAPIKCDGQGGYTIQGWFTKDLGYGIYNQFIHPVNDYLYYGKTSFWIDANSASPSYNAQNFDDAKLLFDGTSGLKLAPNVNDVMNDGTNYLAWSGSSWDIIDESLLGGFEFNYAKYRTAWNIPTVDILHVLLGTNDFAGASSLDFDSKYKDFKARYEVLISSVKEDLPNCKIVVGIPVSSGKQGKYGTISSEQKKRAYWLLANALNTDYSNREDENIYLLDYHTQVDRVYGYDNTQEEPFGEYDGYLIDDESLYKIDNVHLGADGFDQMGLAYMAIVQELR